MTEPTTAPRRIEYVALTSVTSALRNPKGHDLEAIKTAIRELGFGAPGLHDDRTGRLVAGHGRLAALAEMHADSEPLPDGIIVDPDTGEWAAPIVYGWASADDDHAEAMLVADNHLTEKGGWDDGGLAEILTDLGRADPALLAAAGYDQADLDALLADITNPEPTSGGGGGGGAIVGDPDDIPEPPAEQVTVLGDLWQLGPHRLLCGDSTSATDVARLADGETVTLIHADPPYGMGKEADGILNDNLHGPKLDAFQMAWWQAWAPTLADNGSAYIWGNAPDLWRLWYTGGLAATGDLVMRNELVWDKGSGMGMRSAGHHSYPTATERCLFVMRGEQFLGNQNKDDYWEGYEPLRAWLCTERDRAGWTSKDINTLTGTQMSGHWFSQSQFIPIPERHYRTLQEAAAGRAFTKDYAVLFAEMFPEVTAGGNEHRRELAAQLRDQRSYFDNAHDSMSDVWQFPRVVGEERHGHATPKPVAMVERAFRSSTRPGDLIAVPFAGTGPEFIAAHRLGRRVIAIELEPRYIDVIARRYQRATGDKPIRNGQPENLL